MGDQGGGVGLPIAYCDGPRFKRLFLAGTESVVLHRAELDRINVFPVPDGDTGSNVALTLQAMARAVASVEADAISELTMRVADAGVVAARGNSGMLLSHFFLGIAEGLAGVRRAGAMEIARALRHAVEGLYAAVEEPVEGTLLTVVRETSEDVQRCAGSVAGLDQLATRMRGVATASLSRTPELLPELREAGVVDAGGRAFVCFLEGIVDLVEHGTGARATRPDVGAIASVPDAAGLTAFPEDGDRAQRYCAEYLVRGQPPPDRRALAHAVHGLGGSLIINRASRVAKIHIHTDEPPHVERALSALGGRVECVKLEDMRAQHRRRHGAARVAIVTDSACDLSEESIIDRSITVIHHTATFGEETFRDQLDITHQEFLARLVDPGQPHPTTSQPAPAGFTQGFRRAAESADEVLAILVSGGLSGTVAQARAAATRFEGATVRVFDSRSASLGLGFLVLRAVELAAEGRTLDEIESELERVRRRSGMLLTLDTLEYLRRSGRVRKARAFLADLFDLKPILELDDDGCLVPVDRVRGGGPALRRRVVELLEQRVPARRRSLSLGIVHVMAPAIAETLERELESRFAPDSIAVSPATGVLAAHTGPGAWAICYQAE